MQIAADLHISEEDILDWPLQRYSRWLAFYRQRNKEQEKASRRANKRSRG